jgi:hypothetical protein
MSLSPPLLAFLFLLIPGCTSSGQGNGQSAQPVQPAPPPPVAPQRAPAPTSESSAQPGVAEIAPRADQVAQLRWELEVAPKSMTMAQRRDCRIRIGVTNDGPEPVAPPLHLGQFTINGQPSMGFSLSFENGVMDNKWMSLPPGETVSATRGPCEQLLERPGDYTLGFQHGTSKLTAVVRVTP